MPTRLVENRKLFQSVHQASREKLDFKAIALYFFQGDFSSERAAFSEKKEFVNHVPVVTIQVFKKS